MTSPSGRRHHVPTRRLVVLVGVVAGVTGLALPAGARFDASGTGSASTRAATLPIPAAPGIVSVTPGLLGLACVVTVSWPAPPAGSHYRILRTIGTTTTEIVAPTTSAGTFPDTMLLSTLEEAPSYVVRASRVTAPQWIATSPPSVATACLGLL